MSCRADKLPVNGCGHFNRLACPYSLCNSNKLSHKPVKKVISSRKLGSDSSEVKSRSTGVINNKKILQGTKLRKITKSDKDFDTKNSNIDFCRKCGDNNISKNGKNDYSNSKSNVLDSLSQNVQTQVAIDKERSKNRTQKNKKNKVIKEYYKNENFKGSASSVKDINSKTKNKNLDPIKERNEDQVTLDSADSIYEIYPNPTEEFGYLEPEDTKIIEELKDFRKRNYFECHSAKSRIANKGSVTNLNDHKCSYRFYLNDRLFPVPLHTDHHGSIRCIECHLPIEGLNTDSEYSVNGTIQTKVRIGNEVQDMIIMLPVKKPFIVQQKRGNRNNELNDVLYFGVVKLNYDGDSIFSRNVPCDSLALKYQKGYKVFVDDHSYQYEKINEDDVIVI